MIKRWMVFFLMFHFSVEAVARDPKAVKQRLLKYAKENGIYIPPKNGLDARVAERRKDDYSVVPAIRRKNRKYVAGRLKRYRQLSNARRTQTIVQQAAATTQDGKKKPYVYTERLKMATQETVKEDRGFHISPNIGTNMSWFDIGDIDGDVQDVSIDPGFSLGVNADVAMGRFVIESGIVLQQSNISVKLNRLNDQTGDIDWTQTLNYIYVPALVRYNIFNWAHGRFYGLGGMKFGFLLSADATVSKVTNKKSTNSNVVDKTGDNTEFFNSMDVGVIAGVGGSTPLSDSLSAFLETNFYYGFTDASAVSAASLNNASFSFLFGVRTSINL